MRHEIPNAGVSVSPKPYHEVIQIKDLTSNFPVFEVKFFLNRNKYKDTEENLWKIELKHKIVLVQKPTLKNPHLVFS